MIRIIRLYVCLASLLFPTRQVFAQPAIVVSGHWQGSLRVQDREIRFAVDLVQSGNSVTGTIDQPDERINALPLQTVTRDGRSLEFWAREDQRFAGVLAESGTAIAGDFTIQGYTLPFTMTRTGAATLRERPTSAPVTSALEGRWTATLQGNGATEQLALVIVNGADGRSTATLANESEGGLQIPATLDHQGTRVTLTTTAVAGRFVAELDAAGTRMTGNLTQGSFTVPLTFTRASTSARR